MSKLELIATSTFGLESLVSKEVKDLGYHKQTVENGKVKFIGDEKAICRANLWLRTADRVLLNMGEFTATSFEELFQGTRAIPWGEILPENAKFPVEGKSVKSQLYSVPDCQAIVKKAVVESMKESYGLDWFQEDGPLYKIEVSILKDVVTLTIDTTGAGLHKRGYRKQASYAPLKETLAAALIMISRWNPDTALIDPFCGSGTIPIEAAFIGQNLAPGMNREFISGDWPNIPRKLWVEAREETHDVADYDRPLYIQGTDILDNMVKLARYNAYEAMVDESIHFQKMNFRNISSSKKYGKIICNPPYGERLEGGDNIDKLYQGLGEIVKDFPTWSYYVLTSHPNFEKLFGKKASKRRKLYNGRIEVHYYQYFGPKPKRKD